MEISVRELFLLPEDYTFTENLVRLNSLDFARWKFLPGMLFKAEEKWWTEGRRARVHNGLDLRLYETKSAGVGTLSKGVKIPLLKAGRAAKITPDFIGHSIFVEHDGLFYGGKRLFTVYGHLVPEKSIEGGHMDCGGMIGKVAPSKKSAVPPHLHISIVLVPENIPLEDLRWETLDQAEGVAFLDPAEVI